MHVNSYYFSTLIIIIEKATNILIQWYITWNCLPLCNWHIIINLLIICTIINVSSIIILNTLIKNYKVNKITNRYVRSTGYINIADIRIYLNLRKIEARLSVTFFKDLFSFKYIWMSWAREVTTISKRVREHHKLSKWIIDLKLITINTFRKYLYQIILILKDLKFIMFC